MSGVSVSAQFAVKAGMLDEFRSVAEELSGAVEGEVGVVGSVWFVSPDGSTVCLFEQYESRDVALARFERVGSSFADRLSSLVEPTAAQLFGDFADDPPGQVLLFGNPITPLSRFGSMGFGMIDATMVPGFGR